MARAKKKPDLKNCKVTKTTHPKAPWRVSWPVERDGRPVRISKRFATESKAWAHAEATELEIANHGVRFGELPPEARRAFDYYRDTAIELAEFGATVPRFEQLVADALERIRADHADREKNNITVAEAVEAFLDYKRTRVQERQLTDLKTRLKRLAETFGVRPVRSITTAEIEQWLASLRSRKNPEKLDMPPLLGPLARNHYRANLHAFFAYGAAAARGWAERNPVADLEPETVQTGEPEAYTPEDAAKLMQAALNLKPELVPVLALGMFTGLRVSEAAGADLAKLPKDAGEFRTTGKTGPRMAPFTDAAAAWMAAQPRRTGKAWMKSQRMLVDDMQELFTLAKVTPIANGARHSFITYRTAETRDVARVADECGNSVSTIKNHYRQLVTAEAAERFFAIRPEAPAQNVTSIQEGRATA
ncbi:MAG: site-specific integrase [Luteolibacter sp.]